MGFKKGTCFNIWTSNIEETSSISQLRYLIPRLRLLILEKEVYDSLKARFLRFREFYAGDEKSLESLEDLELEMQTQREDTALAAYEKSLKRPKQSPKHRREINFPKTTSLIIDNVDFESGDLFLESNIEIVRLALEKFKGHRRLASEALGISIRNLTDRINRYNLVSETLDGNA
jgi:DNA-binding NtrC family response regulator